MYVQNFGFFSVTRVRLSSHLPVSVSLAVRIQVHISMSKTTEYKASTCTIYNIHTNVFRSHRLCLALEPWRHWKLFLSLPGCVSLSNEHQIWFCFGSQALFSIHTSTYMYIKGICEQYVLSLQFRCCLIPYVFTFVLLCCVVREQASTHITHLSPERTRTCLSIWKGHTDMSTC